MSRFLIGTVRIRKVCVFLAPKSIMPPFILIYDRGDCACGGSADSGLKKAVVFQDGSTEVKTSNLILQAQANVPMEEDHV